MLQNPKMLENAGVDTRHPLGLGRYCVELHLGPAVHPAPGTQLRDEPERVLEYVARKFGGARSEYEPAPPTPPN